MVNTEPGTPPAGEAAATSAFIGRVIDDRYRIVEVLGEGGMGAVFVAEHLKLRKLVALKTIRAEFASNSQAEARFAREALATAQIEHPHVASAMDFGHLPEGGAYLVIQLVRGQGLAKRFEAGPMPWRQVCELGAQIADALAAAHAVGIIHRDLKPDNILLEQREGSLHAKVVDFGIARVSGEHGGAVADSTQPITRMGAVIGTPGYMAPEQAVGQQIDARVDLYALGVILWEAATGRSLWDGESLTELFARQLSQPAPSLHAVVPGQVPPMLAAVVETLLARDPDQRPATAVAVRDELRRVLASAAAEAAPAAALGPGASAGWPAATGSAQTVASLSMAQGTATGLPAATSGRATLVAPATGPIAVHPPATVAFAPAAAGPRARLRQRLLLGAVGLVALIVVVRRLGGDDPAPGTPAPVGVGAATRGAPAAPPAEDVALPTPASIRETIPAPFTEHAETLLFGEDGKERRRAGESIADASDEDKAKIPEYIRNVAWIEKSQRCETKKAVLEKIEETGDVRALPALKIIAGTRRDGCRDFFYRTDCLACMREDLARIIARFEGQVGGG